MHADADPGTGREQPALGGTPRAPEGKPVPRPVTDLAAGRPVRAVWDNAVGGRTFEVGAGERRIGSAKWQPAGPRRAGLGR